MIAILFLVTVADVAWVKFLGPSRPQSIGWRLDEQYLPSGSARFFIDKGLDGPFYNSGHIGGYLAWTLYPQQRVFQCNHGAPFGDTYRYVGNPRLLEPYDLRFAFVADSAELTRLFPASHWARIYRDPGAVLVARRSEENGALISRYEMRTFHPMMSDAQHDRMAAFQLPRLLDEIAVYLAYRSDKAVAQQWLRLAEHNPGAVRAMAMGDELSKAVQMNPALARFYN